MMINAFQPNMVFNVGEAWMDMSDYVNALNTKYRTQFKRARKKNDGVVVKNLSIEEVVNYRGRIFELYEYVQQNATFNTFVFPRDYFEGLKQYGGDKVVIKAYFMADTMIGFCTLIDMGEDYYAYFLGYDPVFQKDKMLYLNMCYDMIEEAICHRKKNIYFSRTAMEIKSSVGAVPVLMYGVCKHNNPLIHGILCRIEPRLVPQQQWQTRTIYK